MLSSDSFKFLYLFIGFFLFSQNSIGQNQLTVTFTNIETAQGEVLVSLHNETDLMVGEKIITAKKPETIVVFENLKKGKYVIKAFHDINSNRKLDTGTFGIPKEPYGFSNDARGRFGPPDLEDQLFDVKENLEIKIKLH